MDSIATRKERERDDGAVVIPRHIEYTLRSIVPSRSVSYSIPCCLYMLMIYLQTVDLRPRERERERGS